MKVIKTLAVTGLMIMSVCSTFGQGYFDIFGSTRTFVIAAPPTLTDSYSNNPVDIHGCQGVAKLDIFVGGMDGPQTLTVQAFTSPDQTNWTALANYALATSTTVIYTNTRYNTATNLSLKATNTYNWPGTITTPTAATAGWASQYTAAAPFTNSGTVSFTTNGIKTIGFVIADADRYLNVLITGATNVGYGAVLTARRQLGN